MATQDRKKIYLNDAQYYSLAMSPRNLIDVCGRGIGKGLIQAKRMLDLVQFMPRCSIGFVVPSVKRGLTNILREFGIRKGLKKLVISSKIHIFIGENQ